MSRRAPLGRRGRVRLDRDLSAGEEAAAPWKRPIRRACLCGSLLFDTAGCTMMGILPQPLPSTSWPRCPARPFAMAATAAGWPTSLKTFAARPSSARGRFLVPKANCGVPAVPDGELHWPSRPGWPMGLRPCDMGGRINRGSAVKGPEHCRADARALRESRRQACVAARIRKFGHPSFAANAPPRPQPREEAPDGALHSGACSSRSDARRMPPCAKAANTARRARLHRLSHEQAASRCARLRPGRAGLLRAL